MKRIVMAIALLSSLIFLESCSRGPMDYGMYRGGGRGGCYERDCQPGFRTYSKATVETFSGEVVSVTPVMSRPGHSSGIHLLIKTDKETVDVHLGPAWYIARQNISFQPGDRVEVTGFRLTDRGKVSSIAQQVKKGKDVLLLRDSDGFTLWSLT